MKALRVSVVRVIMRQGEDGRSVAFTTEFTALATRSEAIRSNMTASTNLVRLFKALGGGWQGSFPREEQHRDEPASTPRMEGQPQ